MKYPSIAHSTTLVRLKLFHLHFFVLVCLLVVDFFLFRTTLKFITAFSQSLQEVAAA